MPACEHGKYFLAIIQIKMRGIMPRCVRASHESNFPWRSAASVTGSRYPIEAEGQRILVDCGSVQGYKELRLRNLAPFPSPAESCGYPDACPSRSFGLSSLLVKQGFRGKIYCTPPTLELCKLLLPDSGYLQEEDARRANRYGYTKHRPALPLYTLADAEKFAELFSSHFLRQDAPPAEGIHFRFERVGHILGAAWVLLTAEKRRGSFFRRSGTPR